MQIAGKVAVVTGGSSGIGRALAVELGLRGARVVVAARSPIDLRQTSLLLSAYGVEHLAIPFDVTKDRSAQELVASVQDAFSTVDIFVNNAGLGLFENAAKSTSEDVEAVFNTNFFGPLRAMRTVVPLLQNGMLVNISSAAAKHAPYRQGIYAASKAALERVTEAVALEEAGHMKTLLVVPDRTETNFTSHVVGSRENTTLALKLKSASAEAVAKTIANAIQKDKALCYTTLKSRVYAVLSAVFPAFVRNVIRKTAQ